MNLGTVKLFLFRPSIQTWIHGGEAVLHDHQLGQDHRPRAHPFLLDLSLFLQQRAFGVGFQDAGDTPKSQSSSTANANKHADQQLILLDEVRNINEAGCVQGDEKNQNP